jgi:hypothetical protein
MLAYFDLFPEKCATELRTAQFPAEEGLPFPPGTYIFTEFFCPDLTCDCRRVLIKVLHAPEREDRPQEIATISYCWHDSPDASWQKIIGDSSNPILDPFHRQAGYAEKLMEFWHDMLGRDQKYAERLQRHYAELRRMHGRQGSDLDELETLIKPLVAGAAEHRRRQRLLQRKQASRNRRRPQ